MKHLIKLKQFFKDVLQETEQLEISRSEIIYEILYSKRLLIEHVEILEEALFDVEKALPAVEKNLLNGPTTVALIAFTGVVTSLLSRKTLPLVLPTAGYSILYILKTFRRLRSSKNKHCLSRLLKSVEDFENVIKKHILFFNELQRFKVGQVVDDQIFVNTCIQSLRDVILVLYDAIKELEAEYIIDKKYEIVYEMIEDLCQTEYFTKDLDAFTSKNIKEFLRLFLYVQSQYLLRLSLIVACGGASDETFIQYNTMNLAPMIDEQTTNCNYNFDIIMFVSNPEKPNYVFKKLKENVNLPPLLLRSKSYCMTFLPKILAIAHQSARLEAHLHRAIDNYDENDKDQDDFHDLIPFMSQLDTELLSCQEEFQRLNITYQKFLNLTIEQPETPIEAAADDTQRVHTVEHDFKKVGDSVFGHHDEFFALDTGNEREASPKEKSESRYEDEDEVINRKIVKRAFKPVLSQLKQKIVPLADAMKERERKVLKEKGFDCEEKLSDFEMLEESSSDDDRPRTTKKSSEKYNELRELLVQKQQMNPFAMHVPAAPAVKEDVIE